MRLICFATKGAGSNEEERIAMLLEPLEPQLFAFDHTNKPRSFVRLLRLLLRSRPDLVVMEGTGIAGGVAILVARWLRRIRFVVSSGDAVAPFIAAAHPLLRPLAYMYERMLYRYSVGFIGWTPYLVGRALTWGVPRAMTAAGWAPHERAGDARHVIRRSLGIPDDAVVFGLVGALGWNRRAGYCYGYELVEAAKRTTRRDVYVVVAGDGSGRARLERIAGRLVGERVLLPGAIAQSEVPRFLSAMDVVSLPQSVDGVGSFRFTTKVSEYLGAGRPIVTGQIPFSYEFDDRWLWRLPGDAPWDERYIDALARLMDSVTPADIAQRSASIPETLSVFEMERQQRQVVSFVQDVLGRGGRATGGQQRG